MACKREPSSGTSAVVGAPLAPARAMTPASYSAYPREIPGSGDPVSGLSATLVVPRTYKVPGPTVSTTVNKQGSNTTIHPMVHPTAHTERAPRTVLVSAGVQRVLTCVLPRTGRSCEAYFCPHFCRWSQLVGTGDAIPRYRSA